MVFVLFVLLCRDDFFLFEFINYEFSNVMIKCKKLECRREGWDEMNYVVNKIVEEKGVFFVKFVRKGVYKDIFNEKFGKDYGGGNKF